METLGIMGIVILAFIIFVIFFIFKALQFVISAVNLYKKIINREDTIIQLLLDIRDNTKKCEISRTISDETNTSSTDIRDQSYKKTNEKSEGVNINQAIGYYSVESEESTDGDSFFCDNCKADVPADAKSCPKCGTTFE